MEILLLGPVELTVGGHVFELTSDKVRCLVAALALEVGRPISRDTLMERLWDGDPPQNKDLLYSHVSRARRQLREAAEAGWTTPAAPDAGGEGTNVPSRNVPTIDTRAHTYTLLAAPESVDWHRFRLRCEQARLTSAKGDDQGTVELLAQARALWRGEPLAGLPGVWPTRVRRMLRAEYLGAMVTSSAAALRLGHFETLVSELSELVEKNPSDEQLASYLMLACYGSDRHSEAVRLYQRLNQWLRSQHGAEPGAALARVYEGVVAGRPVRQMVHEMVPGASSGPSIISAQQRTPGSASTEGSVAPTRRSGLGTSASGDTGGGETARAVGAEQSPKGEETSRDSEAETPNVPRPKMLPRQTVLEGRQSELHQLTEVLRVTSGRRAPGRLATVSGMPGVGKTALAISAAAQLSGEFPSGELYVDLRGHDGSKDPLRPETALGILLRALGAPAESVPVDVDECAAMWRAMLASRRCVIVLDDAADAEQVTPMLPGESASAMVITSRRYLAGLADAHTLRLEALPQKTAIVLFRRLAGEERARDVGEAARIVRLCGYLPLAVELAAMRFRGRPTWELGTLTKLLSRSPGRLDELRDLGDQRGGVLRVFSMSYRSLGPDESRGFRLLSLHPGSGFSAEAAAALLDLSLPRAERLVEALLSSSLLQEVAANRYRFHDLLGEYASLLLHSEDSADERTRAMTRLTLFYIGAAQRADRLAYPHSTALSVGYDLPEVEQLPFEASVTAARAWFEAERQALLGSELHARTHGAQDRAALLGQYMASFLEAEGHWIEAKEVSAASAEYWRREDHSAALSRSLLALSASHAHLGEYAEAAGTADESLQLARDGGDKEAEVEALLAVWLVQWQIGEYRRSLPLLEAAYQLSRKSSDRWTSARIENNLALVKVHLGDSPSASEYFRKAIEGFREAGDGRRLGRALSNAGALSAANHNTGLAREMFEEAIPLLQASGSRQELASTHTSLADLLKESGDAVAAISLHRDALSSFRVLGDVKNQANTLNGMGESFGELGRFEEARECHEAALKIAHEIGALREETMAHRGLGYIDLRTGRLDVAGRNLRAAAMLAERTNDVGEYARVREVLADVYLALGRSSDALNLLERAGDSMTVDNPEEAQRLRLRAGAVRAARGE
ncbi:tetratricopeptide repeat protein [Streptomyces sp. TS71-3]|uniref:AfsR/SARP family transcriptional regulator n=1 Tax=Streptomyces sp. TS71-3 TaxID=2733862 RepID=UPI001B25FD9E|nr:tetratricopeptide repeat protein [Streptomyces sp. TS71-3]GHJ39962.1 hypothetical protein Sm713_55710 [Streptomyces sp. TS71-3]